MEKDDDGEFGSITNYDYGFRIYNPAIGKFLSVDPLTREYPYYTPYQFAGNKPIKFIDLDGLEEALKKPEEGRTKLKKQTAADHGLGLLEHQVYTITTKATREQFQSFVDLYTSTPQAINNNKFATYQPVDINGDKKLSEGDEVDIDILGPVNGVVSVDRIEISNDGFDIYFHTLEGHPDAGNIRFSGKFDNSRKEFTFQIYNITRVLAWIELFPVAPIAARYAQEWQWEIVLDNVDEFMGNDVVRKDKVITGVQVTTFMENQNVVKKEYENISTETTILKEKEKESKVHEENNDGSQNNP